MATHRLKPSFYPRKVTCPVNWGEIRSELPDFIICRIEFIMSNVRNIIIKLRVNKDELQLFKDKARRYQNMSSMIRDAVSQFNDIKTKGEIEVLTEIKNYYTRFDQRLGWLGGNINQAQHRANELAIAGLLSSAYIQQVLFPKIKEALQLIREMKAEQDAIYAKLLKL